MPQKHSAVWIVAIVLALALGGAAFFLTRGQDPADGADGSAAAREPGSGAQPDAATAHAKNGAGDPKAGDSKIGDPARASAAASDEAALAELGETVVVKGKLLVLETGEVPKRCDRWSSHREDRARQRVDHRAGRREAQL